MNGNHVPEPGATDPRSEKTVNFNILNVVRRHKGILALCSLAGLAVGLVVAFLSGSLYESTAQILVLKKHLDSSPLSGPLPAQPQMDDYLSSHQVIITSPRVVDQAIREGNLKALSCLQHKADLRKAVTESLSVNRVFKVRGGGPPNNILNLGFQADNPDDPPIVLGAIIASYEKFLKDTYRNITAEALELIAKAREVLKNDLEARESAYQKFRETNLLLGRGKDGQSVPEARLHSIDLKRSFLRMRQVEIQAFLTAIDSALKKGATQEELLDIVAAIPPNQGIITSGLLSTREPWQAGRNSLATIEEEFVNLQLQESKLLEDYGPKHPQVLSVQKRLEAVRGLIRPSTALLPNANRPQKDQNIVDLKMQILKQELNDNTRTEKALKNLYELEVKEARSFIVSEAQDEFHRKAIERSRLLYESIVKRLQEIDTVKDYGGFNTHPISRPEAGKWVWRKPLLIVGIVMFLGLAVGLVGSYVAETKDQSFRTPNEIRQHLGLPVISHIPEHARAPAVTSNLDQILCTYHQPNSGEAEAYRAVRTALHFRTPPGQHMVLQITSPDKGDGKTTLSANLAVSLAQMGKTVVLVDADLKRPRLHAIFGQPNDVGLSSLLADQTKETEVIHQTMVPGVSVLSSGPLPPNPSELLTLPHLNDVLNSLRQRFDYVLVDTPPLLAGTDAAVVGPRADWVILALRNNKHCRPRAERAKGILDQLGAKVLGIVVMNARSGHGFEPYTDTVEY